MKNFKFLIDFICYYNLLNLITSITKDLLYPTIFNIFQSMRYRILFSLIYRAHEVISLKQI